MTAKKMTRDVYQPRDQMSINAGVTAITPMGGSALEGPITKTDILAAHRPYGLDCKCGQPINSDEAWARHVDVAMIQACTIRTAEELDALPIGSVVRDRLPGDPVTCEKQETHGDPRFENPVEWFAIGDGTAPAIVYLPALLIWSPAWERP